MTIAHGINQRGDVSGEFADITGGHAFIRFHDGTFSPPISHPDDPAGETFGADINRGAPVGYDVDLTTFILHSFLCSNQTFTSLDIGGAVSTTVLGLNSAGSYSGAFDDGSATIVGFVSVAGQATVFAIPGASFTSANAINDRGSTREFHFPRRLSRGDHHDPAGN